MIELQERIAMEREEIAKRIAIFRANQEKFKRERDNYFVSTLGNAKAEKVRVAAERPPFW